MIAGASVDAMKTLLILALLATTAHAGDAVVASTVQEDFKITYARDSGESATATLGKGASATGYTQVKVTDRGSTAITISDGTGAVVAKGTVADNGYYLLMPKGKGYALEKVGVSAGGDKYQGVVIVNALPESYKVDLFGHFGKVGLKDVKVAKSFDVKGAVKTDATDDRYKVVVHLPDGTTQDSFGMVITGRYHVIHKTYDDKITVSELGWIEMPKAKK